MEKILSIVEKPYITSRLSNAFQLSAIQALSQYSDVWLCEELINLRYIHGDKIPCDLLRNDFWFTGQKMFVRENLLFSKDTLKFDSFDVIKYIIFAIDNGKYVIGDYNEFYIPYSDAYHKYYKQETYMIYGYNVLNEVFYVMGQTIEGYSPCVVKFKDYLTSIANRDDNMFNINTMKYNEDYIFSFDKERMFDHLNAYIQSKNSPKYDAANNTIYGIDAIKTLQDTIMNNPDEQSTLMERSFCALCEHKFIMYRRVKYIYDHISLHVNEVLSQAAQNYSLSTLIKQHYCQKHTGDKEYHSLKMAKLFDEIIYTDEYICAKLMSLL